MRLQLGLLHTNGQAASPNDLEMLLGEFANKHFDLSGQAASESVLMAYRADPITSEEDGEVQPLERDGYILTWDGRLDNRRDFAICFPDANLRNLPDPQIVLKAFQMFGESGFRRLVGEFALTLWCARTRSLVFARSPCGTRPLYYVLKKSVLMWSSHFAHLVQVSGADVAINDTYVLQYLVTTPDVKHTPLANFEAIPPNRIVRFENGRMKYGSELWNPTCIQPLRYRTDNEYEEHCRELVTEAVEARLRTKQLVFAELSGGLDSSTVVLTADRILLDRNESPERLQTVSCVYEESRSADERGFIQAVEDQRAVPTHLIHEKEQRITLGLNDPVFTGLPTTLHCFPGRYEVISELMRRYDARVLLTGRGGDHLFWSAPHGDALAADGLVQLNFVRAHRECRTWSRAVNAPYYEFLTKRAFRLALGSFFPRKFSLERPEVPDWVAPKHRATMRTLAADFEGYTSWRAAPGRRAQVFAVDWMFRMLGGGFGQEYTQIYASHPYSHRPLIEFCLGAPLTQFLRDGQTRSLMRRAFRGLLPAKTAKRVSKGLVDETVLKALAREQGSFSDLSTWQVCQRGYVLPLRLSQALHLAQLGLVHLFGPLIRLFSLERWLRSLNHVKATSFHDSAQSCVR